MLVVIEWGVLGAVAGLGLYELIKSALSASPTSLYPIVTVDPRVIPGAPLGVGVSPCPSNPAAPDGFAYWPSNKAVSANVSAWASSILNSYPIGTFIVDQVDGQIVAARVEYHTTIGATGQTGCFKGVSLMIQASG